MKHLFSIVSLALCLTACTKEVWTEEQAEITDQLIAKFYSPALYTSCGQEGDTFVFGFSDGSTISIDTDLTPVFDASGGSFPDVQVKKGFWRVNGEQTHISLSEGEGNMRSKTVCAAYDCNAIYIYMSNGNVLHIPSTREGSLWGFEFLEEDNPELGEDVVCTINNTKISGKFPSGLLSKEFCPHICYRGSSVSVKGKPQRNRKSTNNYSGSVEYVLTLFDESQITYTVSISEPYPSVWLYTDNGKPIVSKDTYVSGRIKIYDPENKYWAKSEFISSMQIRGRGNSTWNMFPKKPYKIKLDSKASIFGMNDNKDWALMANYTDKSLLRNTMGMELSRICRMSWTPGVYNVDVYLNDDYIGSYDFTEHKEVAKHRINIDIAAGDCYLEIEAKKDNPVWFDTPMHFPIMFTEPELPSEELKAEIIQYFTDFEKSLTASYFKDPDKGYRAYVDVDSFVNHYIIQELAKNIDADLFKSLFLVKRKTGKLEFYHVWDFDLAFGNCNYLNAHKEVSTGPTGWYIRNHTQEGINTGWYYYMFKDPYFVAKVKKRWNEVYPQLVELPEKIIEKSKTMYGSAGRNFTRWGTLDKYVWPNVVWLGDYGQEVDYMLGFYRERVEWMNNEISKW